MHRKLTKAIFIIMAIMLTAFPLSAAFADVSGNAEEISAAVDVTVPENTSGYAEETAETIDVAAPEDTVDAITPADTSGNAEEATATDAAAPAEPEKSVGINYEAVEKAFSSTRDML